MSYYFSTTIPGEFRNAVSQVKAALQKFGFGILSEIDIQDTLKRKLGFDFREYVILGACNPAFAVKALQAEDKIGTMLPCNVIVQKNRGEMNEVAAIDPLASMQAVDNPELKSVADQVSESLKMMITSL